MVERLTLVVVLFAAVAVNLWPILYAFRPWYTRSQGRALMVKSLGNVILIDMSLAALIWPDYPGRPYVRLFGFTVFAAGIWYLVVTLLRAPDASRYPPQSWSRQLEEASE